MARKRTRYDVRQFSFIQTSDSPVAYHTNPTRISELRERGCCKDCGNDLGLDRASREDYARMGTRGVEHEMAAAHAAGLCIGCYPAF